jgi:hypothetical protein
VRKHFERIEPNGDLLLTLREYPVREVLAVYAYCSAAEPELEERLDIPHVLRPLAQ